MVPAALAGEREYWDYFYIRPGKYTEDGQLREPTNWESKFGRPLLVPLWRVHG